MPLVIGIDPGQSGALAILSADGTLELLANLPVIRDGRLSWIDGGRLQAILLDSVHGRPATAFVERVSAMPRQGIASAFNFGAGYGAVLAILKLSYCD